jgi:hypothetical protein
VSTPSKPTDVLSPELARIVKELELIMIRHVREAYDNGFAEGLARAVELLERRGK